MKSLKAFALASILSGLLIQTASGKKKPPEPAYQQCKGVVCITDLVRWYDNSRAVKGTLSNNSPVAFTNVTLYFEVWSKSSITGEGIASVSSIPANTKWTFTADLSSPEPDITKARPSRISFSMGDRYVNDTLEFEAVCLIPWNIWQRHPCQ